MLSQVLVDELDHSGKVVDVGRRQGIDGHIQCLGNEGGGEGLCVRVGVARVELEHTYLSSDDVGYVEIGQRINNGCREVRVRVQDGSIYILQSTPHPVTRHFPPFTRYKTYLSF